MRILSYVKGLDGSSYHRVFIPNQTINTEVRVKNEINEEDLKWCDILHYSRHTQLAAKFLNEMRAKHNFKIIVDTDDWWEVSKDHPKYDYWRKSNVSLQIRGHLINADAVTCTHERLADEVRHLNTKVYTIPNAIDYGVGQFKFRKQKQSNRIRLLYASTIMNYSNTAIIAGAMRKIKHLPIEVVIAGHHESPLFDILINNLTAGKEIPYRLMPWADSKTYMSKYVGDIGILPSKPTQFNSMKSNLKVLEYAALKMPVVVSEADPYLGMPATYFNGENSFVKRITELVEDAELRKDLGKKLYSWCKDNYSIKSMAESRMEIYKQVYDS